MLILKSPSRRDATDKATFYSPIQSRCHRRVRYVLHCGHAGAPRSHIIKTSFSRSVRGCAVRQHPSTCRQRQPETPKSPNPFGFEVSMVPKTNNKHALSNKLPTYLQSLVCVGSARPSTALTGPGSDAASNLSITLNTWKPPDISSLHNVCRTGIWSFDRCKLLFLYQDITSLPPR